MEETKKESPMIFICKGCIKKWKPKYVFKNVFSSFFPKGFKCEFCEKATFLECFRDDLKKIPIPIQKVE